MTQCQYFFIGVDGGATKSLVRIEDEAGQLLGRATNGPANIRLSVPQAWASIMAAIQQVLKPLSIALTDPTYEFHIGMGLAGCEVQEAYQAFMAQPHHFKSLVVTSDAHTACLGAHGGKDGTIIIAGTGVVGYQIEAGQTTKVSGWGFPHDDIGSGAWLGLEAMKLTLQALDGRIPQSALTKAIETHFQANRDALVTWANQANSTAFAELAPIVIQQSQAGDSAAAQLLQQAAHAIDRVAFALAAKQQSTFLPCALVGGIAPFLEPYLSDTLKNRLRPCQSTPDAGAILLVRQASKKEKP